MSTPPNTAAAFSLPGPPNLARTLRTRPPGGAVPGLRYRPAAPADPEKAEEIDRRLEAWARQLDLFPAQWTGDFTQFQFGRAVVLQHPGAADLERLTVAGKLLLAENIVDNCYCEEDEGRGGAHRGLGGRLIMAQSALDPLHGTPELEEEWRHGVQADGPLHSYHWALKDYAALATPSQTDRFVQDIARLHLGDLSPTDRVFDAGCGRGGGSVVAHLRYGCHADGATISAKQADFANGQARKRGIDDKVRYHHRNMLDTGFTPGAYAASWNNESTMYVELDLLFAEHARLLRRGGRYVTITGCYNDAYGRASREVSLINAHYICDIHPRSEYFRAMARNRLVPVHVEDLTEAALPYWELRREADHLVTGIEDTFLTAYRNGSFQYLLIAAERV
ncbi:methyltransferase domain-containing protein [Streptomyces sp. C10]|uniref:methyltransferase domain-containing protein n=1 Tax=Streptomyces sp. C10 TaxID=531941 RepID=UPI00397FECA7